MHRGVYNHSLVLKKKLFSFIVVHSWALKVLAKEGGRSVFTKFRAASCHCVATCPCFASCDCCHDPFTVRSAQTCPPFTGFTQLAHPSRCSRSTLTTVCFCARVSVFTSGLRVHIGSLCSYRLQPRHQIHHWLVTFILQWSVGSMNNTILQTCNVVVVLMQRLASFQHLRLRCKHLLDTEVSVLDSFFDPEVPRVNVFRSLSCSQSIRQRSRRRTITLYFNLHWSSQILEHRSQG